MIISSIALKAMHTKHQNDPSYTCMVYYGVCKVAKEAGRSRIQSNL